jgi:hypothetical protein
MEDLVAPAPGVIGRRNILACFRPFCFRLAGGTRGSDFLEDIPKEQVSTVEADNDSSVGVLQNLCRPSPHPQRRVLNSQQPAMPADKIAVVDRPRALQAENLPQVDRLGKRTMEVPGLSRFLGKLLIEPRPEPVQEAVGLLQRRDARQPHLFNQPVLQRLSRGNEK